MAKGRVERPILHREESKVDLYESVETKQLEHEELKGEWKEKVKKYKPIH